MPAPPLPPRRFACLITVLLLAGCAGHEARCERSLEPINRPLQQPHDGAAAADKRAS